MRREALLRTIRGVYAEHGFTEIATPVVEPIERLRDSDGGENVGMIFEIQRRGIGLDELRSAASPHDLNDLGLRYDLTVPLARFYATEHSRLPHVARLIQIGPVWRAEKPQKGRYRQFTQCDIDTIGEPGTLAEVELIVATLRALKAIGIADAVVRLNDRRLLIGLLQSCGISPDLFPPTLVIIDKLDKVGVEGVGLQLERLGIGQAARTLTQHLARFTESPGDVERFLETIGPAAEVPVAAVADHEAIMSSVEDLGYGASVRFDPSLVRGLGYYTGPIFEIEHEASGKSVGGGGRYDGMIGRFLKRDVPACGFSLGFDRVLEIAPESVGQADKRLALIYPRDAATSAVLRRQAVLIDQGFQVTLMPRAKNMKRVFGEARALGLSSYTLLDRSEISELPVDS
ncbi:histidine--tRNA ligase [Svornostia abyssi]|uniref:Histidine--tRNA ligase n=2 Tax=Svornostia abyssi TaxID=2898438 RepID=A0ABY5PM39_9ACTN|nr:histidine--tRNA ligase [Parviterribacteraceae bacterium J379]